MRIRSILSRCALAATLLSVAACDREPTLPADSLKGRISFSYRGAETGYFLAESGNAANGDLSDLAFAYPYYRVDSRLPVGIAVYGTMRLSDGRYNRLTLLVPPKGTEHTCGVAKTTTCGASGTLVLHAPNMYGDGPSTSTYHYRTIRTELTELTYGRARGTFTMVVVDARTELTIGVVSGKFDVPLASRS